MIEDLEVVEDNIVARLLAQVPDFNQNIVSMGDIEGVQSAVERDPACFVVFETEGLTERDLTGNQEGTAAWHVIILTESLRGQKAGRKGPTGAYKLSRLVIEALRNFDPINNVVGQPDCEFPMYFTNRQPMQDPDTQKYYMWCRFSHPVDTYV